MATPSSELGVKPVMKTTSLAPNQGLKNSIKKTIKDRWESGRKMAARAARRKKREKGRRWKAAPSSELGANQMTKSTFPAPDQGLKNGIILQRNHQGSERLRIVWDRLGSAWKMAAPAARRKKREGEGWRGVGKGRPMPTPSSELGANQAATRQRHTSAGDFDVGSG